MTPLLRKLQESLGRLHLQQRGGLTPATTALVAISGGRDSVALLNALYECGWKNLVLCHVNHSLRGVEAGQDALFVRRLARKYNLPVEVGKFDVRKIAQARKKSLAVVARQVRDEFYLDVCQRLGTPYVFLAHHAGDQAETILGNLCRGSGLRGLGGMSIAREAGKGSGGENGSAVIKLRPLLNVTREEIDEYVKFHNLPFREDSSNSKLIYRRNRLRHQVLPLLNDVFQRDVAPLIHRAGYLAARDEECLLALAGDFLKNQSVVNEDASLSLTPALRGLHDALLSRVLILWLEQIGEDAGIGSTEIEEAMKLLRSNGEPARINLPQNRLLRRKARRLAVVHL